MVLHTLCSVRRAGDGREHGRGTTTQPLCCASGSLNGDTEQGIRRRDGNLGDAGVSSAL